MTPNPDNEKSEIELLDERIASYEAAIATIENTDGYKGNASAVFRRRVAALKAERARLADKYRDTG